MLVDDLCHMKLQDGTLLSIRTAVSGLEKRKTTEVWIVLHKSGTHLDKQPVIWAGRFATVEYTSGASGYYALVKVDRNSIFMFLTWNGWRWSSLWRWRHPEVTEDVPPLTKWPVERPRQWLMQVNRPQPKSDLEAVQTSVQRGRPFGSAIWQAMTAEKLGLESTFQPRGRPRKYK
jgi:putative transposase